MVSEGKIPVVILGGNTLLRPEDLLEPARKNPTVRNSAQRQLRLNSPDNAQERSKAREDQTNSLALLVVPGYAGLGTIPGQNGESDRTKAHGKRLTMCRNFVSVLVPGAGLEPARPVGASGF